MASWTGTLAPSTYSGDAGGFFTWSAPDNGRPQIPSEAGLASTDLFLTQVAALKSSSSILLAIDAAQSGTSVSDLNTNFETKGQILFNAGGRKFLFKVAEASAADNQEPYSWQLADSTEIQGEYLAWRDALPDTAGAIGLQITIWDGEGAYPFNILDAFQVNVDGIPAIITDVEVSGESIDVSVGEQITYGSVVDVSYDPPPIGFIQDLQGNPMGAAADVPAENDLVDPAETDPPVIDNVSVDDDGFGVSIGLSEPVELTLQAPGRVQNLDEDEIGRNTIRWRWDRPTPNGTTDPADHYEVRVYEDGRTVTDWFIVNTEEWRSVLIDPSTTYRIDVRTVNNGGIGPTATDTATTLDPLPVGPVPYRIRQDSIFWDLYFRTGTGAGGFPAAMSSFRMEAKFPTTPSDGEWIIYRIVQRSELISTRFGPIWRMNTLLDEHESQLGWKIPPNGEIRLTCLDSGANSISEWGEFVLAVKG